MIELVPHPTTPTPWLRAIEVEVRRTPGRLVLRYAAKGDIEGLDLPKPATPARTDDLWKHTCFEAFLMPQDGAAYVELNLSPSSQWAAYAFDAERQGMRSAETVKPPLVVTRTRQGRLELSATIDLDLPGDWSVGLTAVIEDRSGAKSYWALSHPCDVPDFHNPGGFTLVVPEPA